MALATEFITLNDGTKISAPADINLMTNFVLREQGDWFEDEIHFVRQFIKEGMNALDIGANYGLYTTAIAKNIGSSGKLWCFEPTPNTANALSQTLAENNFEAQTELVQAGLSNESGEATFYVSPNAELNSLTPQEGFEEITIGLRTLDECAESYSWPKIDFVKLDAEGEEIKILNGGGKFFSDNAPLVMFELKHAETVNVELIDAFKEIGYSPFYLVPGLNILAPFEDSESIDAFALNLFAIKNEEIDSYLKSGLVVSVSDVDSIEEKTVDDALISQLPCFEGFSVDLVKVSELDADYRQILSSLLASKDEALSSQERFDQLFLANHLTRKALEDGRKTRPERLSTLARVAYDSGYRRVANQILMFLFEQFIKPSKAFNIRESFLPVSPEFEQLPSKGNADVWFCSMVVDQLVRKRSFSSFFGGAPETVKFIDALEQLGFAQPDILRRRDVIRARMDAAAS